jgi:hypothetical protein
MSMTPGPNSPNHAAKIPARTLIPARLAANAPMYAARLNSGPGIACKQKKNTPSFQLPIRK